LMQGRQDELIISMVIKPSNQLKITFLEAKDITDLGTLKASKILVPGDFWIRFEEESGALGDYDLAAKKVTPRLKELMMSSCRQSYYAHINSAMCWGLKLVTIKYQLLWWILSASSVHWFGTKCI